MQLANLNNTLRVVVDMFFLNSVYRIIRNGKRGEAEHVNSLFCRRIQLSIHLNL